MNFFFEKESEVFFYIFIKAIFMLIAIRHFKKEDNKKAIFALFVCWIYDYVVYIPIIILKILMWE